MKTAAPLTIRLLGAPEIEIQGEPLDLKNQKARALLFYLAVTGQPHTRSHLATLLWSEFPTDNARRSLGTWRTVSNCQAVPRFRRMEAKAAKARSRASA